MLFYAPVTLEAVYSWYSAFNGSGTALPQVVASLVRSLGFYCISTVMLRSSECLCDAYLHLYGQLLLIYHGSPL